MDARPSATLLEARSSAGVADYSFHGRLAAERSTRPAAPLSDPRHLLEHCHRLGAGGMQTVLPVLGAPALEAVRAQAETYGMFIEGSTTLPRDAADVGRFEAQLRAAQIAGAHTVRIYLLGGRRYEQFTTAAEFRAFAAAAWTSLELGAPVAERLEVRLAIENHKDFRAAEQVALLRRLSSAYVGACVDFGNNLALLEDPLEVVTALAPYAFAAHLKDQALREDADGFWLADVPLGEGALDLPAMVGVLRRAQPHLRFCLETATRDPLKVPCLTDRYWATFAEVPARDLANTLGFVRTHTAPALARVSPLATAERLRLEEANVKQCLAYARERLGL